MQRVQQRRDLVITAIVLDQNGRLAVPDFSAYAEARLGIPKLTRLKTSQFRSIHFGPVTRASAAGRERGA
jgi:hypothetical protein